MDTSRLKQDIKTSTFQPFYIFTGEEFGIQDIYIKKLAGDLEIKRVDGLKDVVKQLNNIALVSTYKCYVIRDDKDLLSAEEIWGNLKAIIGLNRVILVYTTIDKRSKFYKHFKDFICEFNHLNESVLIKYVQKECNLSDNNAKILMKVCNCDYCRILLEIDKIKRMGIDDNTAFEKLLQEGVIYIPPRDAVFMWVDSVLRRDIKLAYELAMECRQVGEASLVMLTNLYNSTRQVLQVQAYQGNNLSQGTGLTPWQIKCAKEKIGHYSIDELVNILFLLREIETGIKIGRLPDELSIDYLMANIFRRA